MKSTKTFSLLTLLLVTAIVALSVSQYSMMQELAAARDRVAAAEAEIGLVRKKYGHISVADNTLTYVAKITDSERLAYRVIIPNGNHYLLHVTETDFPDSVIPPETKPTKTLSMGNWKRGADTILSFEFQTKNEEQHLVAYNRRRELFEYKMQAFASEEIDAWELFLNDSQKSFTPFDPIHFLWRRDPSTKRGILVWMETVSAREARHASEAEPRINANTRTKSEITTKKTTKNLTSRDWPLDEAR